jgi:predicted MPP superfamily phosphohydrolase
VDVPIPSLPRQFDGLRIAQLSDLHAGSLFSARPMEDAVDLVLAERPDLVTITGDYVNHDAAELATILPALDRLRAPLGVFGSLGNHDHYADVRRVARDVDATAVDLLVNDARTLAIDGARLHVAGTDNTGFGQRHGDLDAALARTQRNGDDATLLLAHDPTFWDAHVRPSGHAVDLMLAGHTHGGQVGVELGPLRWSLARVMYPRWAGLYGEDRLPDGSADARERQFLYVNRGLGTVGPPVRLGIRPEITILTLRRA